MTHAFVLAYGTGLRWNNYLGHPKHYAPVDGEPVLARTIRQLREHSVKVTLIAPQEYAADFDAEVYTPPRDERLREADKCINSRDRWPRDDRSVLLWGDTFFTDQAIATIVGFAPREWQIFARIGPNLLTGKPLSEVFAMSLWPEHFIEHMAAAHRAYIAAIEHHGALASWHVYRALRGVPANRIHPRPPVQTDEGAMTHINDWTDDFDTPQDYDQFLVRWNCR